MGKALFSFLLGLSVICLVLWSFNFWILKQRKRLLSNIKLLTFHIFALLLLLWMIAFYIDVWVNYECFYYQMIRYFINFNLPNLGYCIVANTMDFIFKNYQRKVSKSIFSSKKTRIIVHAILILLISSNVLWYILTLKKLTSQYQQDTCFCVPNWTFMIINGISVICLAVTSSIILYLRCKNTKLFANDFHI